MTLDPSTFKVPESFSTERLDIRAPSLRQAAEVQAAIEESFETLTAWLPWATHVYTLQESEDSLRRAVQRWNAREDFRLGVFLKAPTRS